ncbi:MAG: hypothetical protein ACRD22_03170, partial [Terriglobia bacterium]
TRETVGLWKAQGATSERLRMFASNGRARLALRGDRGGQLPQSAATREMEAARAEFHFDTLL